MMTSNDNTTNDNSNTTPAASDATTTNNTYTTPQDAPKSGDKSKIPISRSPQKSSTPQNGVTRVKIERTLPQQQQEHDNNENQQQQQQHNTTLNANVIPTSPLHEEPTDNEVGPMPEKTKHSSHNKATNFEQDLQLKLDNEYNQVLQERKIEWLAIQTSVRQSALLSAVFMAFYLYIGTAYFGQARIGWSTRDSLIFAVYTITTVGYGYHDIPTDWDVQLFVIWYTFVGIAAVTTLLSQAYQFLVLEATRARYEQNSDSKLRRSRIRTEEDDPEDITTHLHHHNGNSGNIVLQYWDKLKQFLRRSKYGSMYQFLLLFFSQWFFGALIVGILEGWTMIEALYWAAVTLTTVGYGDYHPTKNASIWFCIVYLPASVGFLSFFLANVAQLYLRLHHKNTVRIERNMRRQMGSSRQNSNSLEDFVPSEGVVDDPSSSTCSSAVAENNGVHRLNSQFAALPTGDIEMASASVVSNKMGNGSGQAYRDQIQFMASNTSADGSMRAVLDAVFSKEKLQESQNTPAASTSTASNLSSSNPNDKNKDTNFTLRIKVQERIARIIAMEVAGYHTRSEVQDSTASISMPTLSETMDKWIIPRSARSAFRTVAFETILFVGERGLIVRGADAIFDLSPREFQALFAPFLAAMTMNLHHSHNNHNDNNVAARRSRSRKDENVMKRWLLGTNLMADVELKGGSCGDVGGGADCGGGDHVLFMSGIMT